MSFSVARRWSTMQSCTTSSFSAVGSSTNTTTCSTTLLMARHALHTTLPLHKLTMSNRRLRKRHEPSFGLSVPICICAVGLTSYFAFFNVYGSYEDAVYGKSKWS